MDFQKAFARFTFTFNWFYLDHKDIAYQLGGLHPLRAKNTQPDLPVWGTGEWEWRGNLSFAGTPKAISPKKGWMTSWNNKHAPGFRAADSRFSYGPVQRVDLLDKGIKALKRKGKISLVDLVNVMGEAGTTDLRGSHVLPWMLKWRHGLGFVPGASVLPHYDAWPEPMAALVALQDVRAADVVGLGDLLGRQVERQAGAVAEAHLVRARVLAAAAGQRHHQEHGQRGHPPPHRPPEPAGWP